MVVSVIKPTFWGKLFSPIKLITINEKNISFEFKNKITQTYSIELCTDFPHFSENFFGASFEIKLNNDQKIYSMLNKHEVRQAITLLDKNVIRYLESNINKSSTVFKTFAINEYLRDSNIEIIENSSKGLIENYIRSKAIWKSKLNGDALHQIDSLLSYYPLQDKKEDLRRQFEKTILLSRKNFFEKIESNPLTEQQRLAVIRNNDRNLVLAAAGTGKTSVMVAKALNLIDSGLAKSEDILVLAYNNAAAKELKTRLLERSKASELDQVEPPTILTFHALGRQILRDCEVTTYLSEFAEDPLKLEMWITEWITSYITSGSKSLFKFLQLLHEPTNPFDFKSKAEYDIYIRDNEYRTLQGERVRGYQELVIANWLFINGVKYTYEAPFVSKRRIRPEFDYRPDFYIIDRDIYLEHFGIDRNGKTRSDINAAQYNQEMLSKRKLHEECGTTLIETYHYYWTENRLEDELKQLMTIHGVPMKIKTPNELLKSLNNEGIILELAKRYLKCLQAIRVERIDKKSILQRLKNNNIFFASSYADILDELHQSYKKKLLADNRIDFDDMIIRAIDLIDNGSFTPKWKFILVDEFQDISMARMELINSLIKKSDNPILTVVGDDWQSIYRFSGGKLELTTRFGTLVGSHCLTKLEKTYRYNSSIAKTAGTFVMQNPEQYVKQVTSYTQVENSTVYLIDTSKENNKTLETRVTEVINKIRQNDSEGSIAVLARYRYLLKNAQDRLKGERLNSKNIKFWTFHGSKGLEADYCILIGFFQGKTGFPNYNKEEAVVEALLPSLDSFPHSEERRLLYVALTRAKKKCYIIADPKAPSEFIQEMLAPKYQLHIASSTFEEAYRAIFKCPICEPGYFRLHSGKYGNFYSCTSGSVCPSKPRICPKCESPSLDTRAKSTCNNPNCDHSIVLCTKCARPMKLREGKFGKFWGCSGFAIKEDQCKETRKILE